MLIRPLRLQLIPPLQTPLHAALWACASSLALVFAYSCSYNLLLFAPSIYLLQIYDRVLTSRSGDTLLMLTLIVAVTVVVGSVLDALRRAALNRLGGWLEDRLRPLVLSGCLEYAYRNDPAQATDAYRDLTTIRQFVESSACPMLFDALWAPLFVGVLFLVHPLLGMIGACTMLLLFGLTLAADLLTEDALAKSGAALTRSYGRLGVAVGNVHLIRALGMLDGAARSIYQDAHEARNAQELAQRRYEIVALLSKPIRALAQVLIMGAAAWLVLGNAMSPAIIFASTLLFGRALAPVEGAVSGWKSLVKTLAASRRLDAILTATPAAKQDADDPSQQMRGGLVVNDVSVRLPGGGPFLLNGVSFSLAPGECLGIVGPSGSGKSVLGQIIAGISVPTQGRVLLGDVDVAVLRERRGSRQVGYLPQDINLFGETIRDIIARLDETDPQKVIKAAKLAGIHETIMQMPQAYDTAAPGGGVAFSRGYRQRLGLARAFFGDPLLVVLDEPNASLDFVGERMLLDAIGQMKVANIMVIVITHRMGILAATDKLAIMQGGTVAAFGDSEEMFERYLNRPQIGSPDHPLANTSPEPTAP